MCVYTPKSAQIRQQFTICPICRSWQILGLKKENGKSENRWAQVFAKQLRKVGMLMGSTRSSSVSAESKGEIFPGGKPVTLKKSTCGLESLGTVGKARAVASPYLAAASCAGCRVPLSRWPWLLGRLRHSQVLLPSHRREMFVLSATCRVIALILDRLFEQTVWNGFEHYARK